MAIKITPEEYQDKQARRLKGSLDDIRSGISKVTESPTAKAALKKDKMLANLTESVNSGRWASRLNAVTVEQWKDKALTKGVDRIPAGIDGAKDKVIAFAQQLLPYESTLQAQVNVMPDTTLEDSISRATSWMRGMSKFHRK